MKYFDAESMRQEFNVTLQFDHLEKDGWKAVAKKYTSEQWAECGKAILERLEDERVQLYRMLALVEATRKEGR